MKGQISCFLGLMHTDILAFRHVIFDRIINFFVWATTTTVVAAYVFPVFGMGLGYGKFFFAGVLASVGMFEMYARIVELVAEMSDDRPILYYVTLPISSVWLVVRIMISNMVRFMILSCVVFPVGKVVLGDLFSLSTIRWPELVMMFSVASAFYGACSVWLACQVSGIMNLSNVWTRIVFPIWFLGGLQFSQAALAQAVPWLAVVNWCNPAMYITEGFRGAILGAEGFLNIWLCIGFLCVATCVASWCGVVAFRRRLDLIP